MPATTSGPNFSFRLPVGNSKEQQASKSSLTSSSKANETHTSMEVDPPQGSQPSQSINRGADNAGAAPTAPMLGKSAGAADVAASDANGSAKPPGYSIQEALFKAWNEGQITLYALIVANSRKKEELQRRDRLERDLQRFGSFWKDQGRDDTRAELAKLSQAIEQNAMQMNDLTIKRESIGRQFVDLVIDLTASPASASASPSQVDQKAAAEVAALKTKLAEQDVTVKHLIERLDQYEKSNKETSLKMALNASSAEVEKLNSRLTSQDATLKTLTLRLDQLKKEKSLPKKPEATSDLDARYKNEFGQIKKLSDDITALKSSTKNDKLWITSKVEELETGLKKSETSSSQLQIVKKEILESPVLQQLKSSVQNIQGELDAYKKTADSSFRQQIDTQISELTQRLDSFLNRLDSYEKVQKEGRAVQVQVQPQGADNHGSIVSCWAPGSGQTSASFPRSMTSPVPASQKSLQDAIMRLGHHEAQLQQIFERLDKTTSQEQVKRFLELTLEFIPQLQDRASLLNDIQSLKQEFGRGLASVNTQVVRLSQRLQEVANLSNSLLQSSREANSGEISSQLKALHLRVDSFVSSVETLQGHYNDEAGQYQSLQKRIQDFEKAVVDMSDTLGKARALDEIFSVEEAGKLLPQLRQLIAERKPAIEGPAPAAFRTINQPLISSGTGSDRVGDSTKSNNSIGQQPNKSTAVNTSLDLGSSPFAKSGKQPKKRARIESPEGRRR